MVTFMPKQSPQPLPLAFAAASAAVSAAASASSMDNAHVIWRDSNNMIANDTTNDDAHLYKPYYYCDNDHHYTPAAPSWNTPQQFATDNSSDTTDCKNKKYYK